MNNRTWLFCECYDLHTLDNKKSDLFISVVHSNLCKAYFILQIQNTVTTVQVSKLEFASIYHGNTYGNLI